MACTVPAAPVLAANADQPYQNVDKTNDKGNDTGNGRVDTLNRGQLDQNQATAPGARQFYNHARADRHPGAGRRPALMRSATLSEPGRPR